MFDPALGAQGIAEARMEERVGLAARAGVAGGLQYAGRIAHAAHGQPFGEVAEMHADKFHSACRATGSSCM